VTRDGLRDDAEGPAQRDRSQLANPSDSLRPAC